MGATFMELRTIQTFYTIVQSGGFQKAAEILQYSQPTISMRIKQLEEDLGVSLFNRGKTLQLTQAGRLFYERTEQFLAQYDLLEQSMTDLAKGEAGLINIGISEPTASLVFPKVLKDFLADYPEIRVSVRVEDANTCSQNLLDGLIDFAICGAPELILDNYYEPFFYDSLNLLLSENNPLAQKKVVTFQDLAEEVFIFTPENCPIRIQIEQKLKQEFSGRYKKMEVTSSLSHKYYVQQDIGISVFTKTAHSETIAGTVVLPIEDLDIHPPVGLLTDANKHTYEDATLELIRRIIASYQSPDQEIIWPKIIKNTATKQLS